jgi:uncharacterized protein (TIGR02231 family)
MTHVTLYRGQAMVTRSIPIEGAKGSKELVVDLPEQVVADSLFAEGGECVEVRAVQFRSHAVGEESRDEVRKLDEAIEQVNDKLLVNTKAQERLAKQTTYLDQLDGFVAATAKSDLARGVLDAAALEKVTLFSFGQRDTLAGASVTLVKEAKGLNNQLSLLQRRRGELTGVASRTVRAALLFVEKRGEGRDSVRLSYLVGKCEWSPAYTFRAGGDRTQIRVECNGVIQQMSGEDWDGVQLTLSTASLDLSASGPGLAAFSVTLSKEDAPMPLNPGELTARLDAVRERLDAAVALHRGAPGPADKAKLDWALNAAANEFQGLELMSGRDLVSTLQSTETDLTGGPSLSYAVARPVRLASRPDQQMVQIFQTTFESQFYHVATPVLTRHVFREVEATNSSEQDLLAGPMSVYLDDQFVGRGAIPTIARGQMFTLGIGVDPQLRARRELADKTESMQGGNRKLDFKYRLIIENYKDEPAKVRIIDRLPNSGDSAQIRVTLAEMKDALSDDAIYLRRQRPKGILRWEIEVPGRAVRDKARILAYEFSVEFDHNFQLGTLGGQQARSEFEQSDRVRVVPAPAAAPPPPPSAP